MTSVKRNQWVRALTAHLEGKIVKLAERLSTPYVITHKTMPQAGLALVKVREAAFYETYYLGEIPIACAHVQLRDQNGEVFEGAARVMSDNAELAIALAICDAVLANQLHHWESVNALVESGIQERMRDAALCTTMLARTRVDFSLLTATEIRDEA